ncbi:MULTISPECIES: Uma2 family endonuclease [unclassified Coleofasciculus]|uniref:Uma2 family endonuclease n=1 Tax=unclassified Coleofasciculus TaxID=2692782 RepID=UPI00188244DC|nr:MULTISPECIES: Uma2 family endonuclease [unclassified Coleofasciculus]MBE9129771.1 Uma2 family endonuclease [Coleofasciculus sp. LEGE 07081]MBE9148597.1 Uma2 family endonuclease [Coleofasciculus sp. LEGE 07092]
MSVSTPSNAPNFRQTPTVPTEPVWRFSVAQYHQMIRSGILTEDDPVELLEGWIIYKMPKNPPHRAATKLTRNALEDIVPLGWYVDAQEPITLDNSEPEPDVVIVRGNTRDYLDRHPGSQDIALVVEIADSTLERDRTFKKRIYARAGIQVYWIINLPEQQLEVYTEPIELASEPTYQQCQNYSLSDEVAVVIEGREVSRLNVRDLLP